MKKIFIPSVLATTLFFGGSLIVSAQTATSTATSTDTTTTTATTTTATTTDTTSTDTAAQIQALLLQIEQLKAQIAQLVQSNSSLQSTVATQALQLNTQLHQGMSGAEVTQLQTILATDPNIFSKANITGYYGPLTEDAVKQLQQHFGISPVGMVGPQTLGQINALLKQHDVKDQKDLSENDLGDLGERNGSTGGEDNHNASSTVSQDNQSNNGQHSSEGEGSGNSVNSGSTGSQDN